MFEESFMGEVTVKQGLKMQVWLWRGYREKGFQKKTTAWAKTRR